MNGQDMKRASHKDVVTAIQVSACVCMYVCMFMCLFVCMCVCAPVFEVMFVGSVCVCIHIWVAYTD